MILYLQKSQKGGFRHFGWWEDYDVGNVATGCHAKRLSKGSADDTPPEVIRAPTGTVLLYWIPLLPLYRNYELGNGSHVPGSPWDELR